MSIAFCWILVLRVGGWKIENEDDVGDGDGFCGGVGVCCFEGPGDEASSRSESAGVVAAAATAAEDEEVVLDDFLVFFFFFFRFVVVGAGSWYDVVAEGS